LNYILTVTLDDHGIIKSVLQYWNHLLLSRMFKVGSSETSKTGLESFSLDFSPRALQLNSIWSATWPWQLKLENPKVWALGVPRGRPHTHMSPDNHARTTVCLVPRAAKSGFGNTLENGGSKNDGSNQSRTSAACTLGVLLFIMMMGAHPTRKASDGLSSNHVSEPIRMHDLTWWPPLRDSE
jgi:hypothetical protein